MDVKEQALPGGKAGEHWYYRSKQLALDSLVRGVPFTRILDIGAGSAIFSRHRLKNGAASAVCVDPAYPSGAPTPGAESPSNLSGRCYRAQPIWCC